MEPETEQLFRKWLKIQIWKHWLSFLIGIVVILGFLIGGWTAYFFVLPSVKKQIENTQSVLENISTVSETTKNQENLFKNLIQEVSPSKK